MKTPEFLVTLACGLVIALTSHAYGKTNSPSSVTQLDAFMKKWAVYESFRIPVETEDEPLLLAALEKDPKGPWAAYISMKFAQTKYEARKLDKTGRAALYRASLNYLKPSSGILARAAEAAPRDQELRHSLNTIKKHISLASLETGLDLADVKSDAEAALAKNTDKASWNYGNVIYNQHTLLGRVALREGKPDEAKKHLLAAGRTPGSPQLNSFGPDFTLARELAEKGEYTAVLEFLELVELFWANPDGSTGANSKRVAADHLKDLDSWRKQLKDGTVPDHRKWR